MKRRSDKFAKVASLAVAEEQRAGQGASRSLQHLEEQLARLGELNAFQQAYLNRKIENSTMNSAHWQDYQRFLKRLETAVGAQQQIVRDCERSLASHRRRWMASRQRCEALEKLIDKQLTRERQHDARQEQKRLDELPASRGLGFDSDFE